MTDKQLESFYKEIIEFDEFIAKVNSRQDFIQTDKFKVLFPKGSEQTVEIIFSDMNELVSNDKFEKIKNELRSQRSRDISFNEFEEKRKNATTRDYKKEAYALIKKIGDELIEKYEMEIWGKFYEMPFTIKKGNFFIEFFYDYMEGEILVSLLDQSWLLSAGQRIRINRIVSDSDFQEWLQKQDWEEHMPYELNIANSEKAIRYLLSLWIAKDESMFKYGNTRLISKMWRERDQGAA